MITINDVRKAGFCTIGARRWFDQHGIPFNQFLRDGISEEEFLTRGDDLARVVVEKKRERERG